MHTYTVAFRAAGEKLDITNVSNRLALTPTHAVSVGDPQQRGPATKAVWSFEVSPDGGGEWNNLGEALTELLTIFSTRLGVVRQLQQEFDVYLWCGHFTSSFDGGPTLSADLLRRLGDFGCELYLDTYSAPNE